MSKPVFWNAHPGDQINITKQTWLVVAAKPEYVLLQKPAGQTTELIQTLKRDYTYLHLRRATFAQHRER